RPLGALLGVIGHLRALRKGSEPAADDRRMVDEQVFALIVGGDEAKALLVAEPLHGSGCHVPSRENCCAARRGRSRRAITTNRWHLFCRALMPDPDHQSSARSRIATRGAPRARPSRRFATAICP